MKSSKKSEKKLDNFFSNGFQIDLYKEGSLTPKFHLIRSPWPFRKRVRLFASKMDYKLKVVDNHEMVTLQLEKDDVRVVLKPCIRTLAYHGVTRFEAEVTIGDQKDTCYSLYF